MPDDEPPALSAAEIFGDVIALARRFERYFLKDSRYWTQPGMDPATFQRVLADQEAVAPRLLDALPSFEDQLNDARRRRPALRPHLKHLR